MTMDDGIQSVITTRANKFMAGFRQTDKSETSLMYASMMTGLKTE